MGGRLSARATLCLLAGIGALSGGVAGAVIVGRLSVEDSVGTAAARDEPAAVTRPRAVQVAEVAGRSALRQPTPWSAADAEAARVGSAERHTSHRATIRHRPSRTMAPVAAAPVAAPTSAGATTEIREQQPPAPIQARAPAATGGGSARGTAPASPTVRAPAAPKAAAPAPEPAPAHRSPTPDPQPTGAFDDSG
jgi:hypothetical protein